jgi:hypothetical protein
MSQIRLLGSSPIGRVYIPSSPLPQAQEDSIVLFPSSLELEFCIILEGRHNCGIFNQAKKATYCCWLETPGGPIERNTPDKINKDCNSRQAVLGGFQIDQGCIYCKAEQYSNIIFGL